MTHHVLRITSKAAIAIAGINDAPVVIDGKAEGITTMSPVNPWLRKGVNHLTIFLGEKPLVEGNPAPPPVYAGISVYTAKPDSDTSDVDRMLATFEQQEEPQPTLPLIRRIPFNVDDEPPCNLWKDAEEIKEISDRDKSDILGVMDDFARRIRASDSEGCVTSLAYKIKDCALANGQDPASMRNVIKGQFEKFIFAREDIKVILPAEGLAQYRPVCGGKVVWVFAGLTDPALVVTATNAKFTFPIFVAKIGGKWTLVR